MNIGKERRLAQLADPRSRKILIVALDHGAIVGPAPGIEKPRRIVSAISESGCNGVLVHEGFLREVYRELPRDISIVLKLTTATELSPDPTFRVAVSSVKRAAALGAVGVSINLFLGSPGESEMLERLGTASEQCEEYGMLCMPVIYPAGKDQYNAAKIKLAARVGAEVGADLIKTYYTGDSASFREVVEGCPVPVLAAGGPKLDSVRAALSAVEGAMAAGAGGIAIGRNVWQSPDPRLALLAMSRIVHGGERADAVADDLGMR